MSVLLFDLDSDNYSILNSFQRELRPVRRQYSPSASDIAYGGGILCGDIAYGGIGLQ